MSNIIREPNNILEINEAHADNFYIVIPKLPTSPFVSSVFNELTKINSVPTTAQNQCESLNKQTLMREHNLDLTNFKLYLKSFTLPSINIADYDIPTQFATLKRPSKISFTDLNTNLIVSENFLNYNIILYWLYALHNPEEYNKISGREMVETYFVDIYLIVTNNHREKIAEYKFLDAFPKSLPPITFDNSSADNITVDVAWAHSGMTPSNNFILKYV